MTESAELWSKPTNFAVVQLPDRRYPGVVMQGDTLNTTISKLQAVLQAVEHSSDAYRELRGILDQLCDARSFLETVCRNRGQDLPY